MDLNTNLKSLLNSFNMSPEALADIRESNNLLEDLNIAPGLSIGTQGSNFSLKDTSGNFVDLGLSYLETMLILGEVVQESGVIQGCESGPSRRDFQIDWAWSMRDQCARHNVPYFLKQIQIDGKVITEPMLDGVQHLALPEITSD